MENHSQKIVRSQKLSCINLLGLGLGQSLGMAAAIEVHKRFADRQLFISERAYHFGRLLYSDRLHSFGDQGCSMTEYHPS